jgi:hypothetical protein
VTARIGNAEKMKLGNAKRNETSSNAEEMKLGNAKKNEDAIKK